MQENDKIYVINSKNILNFISINIVFYEKLKFNY